MTHTDIQHADPQLTIVSGNPTPEEVAALTVVFTSLAKKAKADKLAAQEQNRWGEPENRFASRIVYNPTAFRNVTFY